jgi:predicted glycosyltransferase
MFNHSFLCLKDHSSRGSTNIFQMINQDELEKKRKIEDRSMEVDYCEKLDVCVCVGGGGDGNILTHDNILTLDLDLEVVYFMCTWGRITLLMISQLQKKKRKREKILT